MRLALFRGSARCVAEGGKVSDHSLTAARRKLVASDCCSYFEQSICIKNIIFLYFNQNDFGPFEYSGHINNKTTMGIASINEMSSQIIYDPVLSWPVPSAWSLQEATTVPLAYAMVITLDID